MLYESARYMLGSLLFHQITLNFLFYYLTQHQSDQVNQSAQGCDSRKPSGHKCFMVFKLLLFGDLAT